MSNAAAPRDLVAEWFPAWLKVHVALFRGMMLPPIDSEEGAATYPRWRSLFARHGLHERAVALEATERLVLVEHKPSQHLRLLIAEAMAVYKERAHVGEGRPTDSRESARLASINCPHGCGGEGLVLRFRRESQGGRDSLGRPAHPLDSKGRPAPDPVTLYCLCPMGRWVKATHERKSPDVRARIWDLADYPWLRGEENRFRNRDDEPLSPAAQAFIDRLRAGRRGLTPDTVPFRRDEDDTPDF